MAEPSPDASSSGDQISAIVAPFRAAGSALGFIVGFAATYRSGGDLAGSTLHGLLGALLVSPLFWFLGLLLVRETIKANVFDQRLAYDARVHDAKRQMVEQMQKQGMTIPPSLRDAIPTVRGELGPGPK